MERRARRTYVGVMPRSSLTVATVDDDRRVRESLQSVLESAGYDAVTFDSAEAFLGSGALASVWCVIADVRLPGIDGTELQPRIRRERHELPVIFITAMSTTATSAGTRCAAARWPSW
jgi:FixJ family two-component response regulator